jgi:hypothetical protein
MGQTVRADDNAVQQKMSVFYEYAHSISSLAYLILRPILIVAGFAMDNSMVYGEIF